MAARLFALVIALATGASGALPPVQSYRCQAMGRTMQATHACCKGVRSTRIARSCCTLGVTTQAVVRADSRGSVPAEMKPPALVGLVSFPPLCQPLLLRSVYAGALPRGQPPGERIDRLSAILRV